MLMLLLRSYHSTNTDETSMRMSKSTAYTVGRHADLHCCSLYLPDPLYMKCITTNAPTNCRNSVVNFVYTI